MTINNMIYFILCFYLLTKDPLYQFQALFFGNVIFKMAFVKLFMLLLVILVIPFYITRIKRNKINTYLFLFVAYIFGVITFINNDFPDRDRLTIYYVSMFLPLLLLIVNLFMIRPGKVSARFKKTIFSSFVIFTLMNCLVGIYQTIRGPEYYEPFYGVELLGITPSKVMTVLEQTRCIGFFLDGVQYGLFLNFALFFFLSMVALRKKYRYLTLIPLLLINIYFTYTRSIYLLALLNMVLLLLVASWMKRKSIVRYLSVKYCWIANTIIAVGVYLYGLNMEESETTKSLYIRFESAQFIVESLTGSLRKMLFGIGYIQNSELFDEFVPDNFMLALVSLGGIVGLFLFMTIFIHLNNMIMRKREQFLVQPLYLTSYLFFSNILAFGMFCNYLDSIFMFLAIPIIYMMKHEDYRINDLQSVRS